VHPYLVRIPLPWGGSFRVASYGFMIMCGFLVSLYLGQQRAKRAGIDPAGFFDAAVAGLLGGVIGARILHVIYEWPYFRANPLKIIRLDQGGLVFYGGAIGGALALIFVVLRKKMPVLRSLDVVASVLPLGHAFGRVGCFLNGCCFGHVTKSPVGVRFPRMLAPGNVADPLFNVGAEHVVGSPPFVYHLEQTPPLVTASAQWSLPVHPTQLYAVGYNLVIFALLTLWFTRRWRDGEVGALYLILYGTARFVNEFFRVGTPVLGGLSVAQVMCVPAVLFGAALLWRGRRLAPQPLPAPWEPSPPQPGRKGKRR